MSIDPPEDKFSLRDIAALHALQGMLSSIEDPQMRGTDMMEGIALRAFDYADLFMAARSGELKYDHEGDA